jgi:membrane protein YdbS with pleckstrin-like domain
MKGKVKIMKDKNLTINTTKSFSLTTLLTVAFVVLKLCGVISWSWFWVLSPLIFGVALGVAFILIALIIVGIVALIRRY